MPIAIHHSIFPQRSLEPIIHPLIKKIDPIRVIRVIREIFTILLYFSSHSALKVGELTVTSLLILCIGSKNNIPW